MRLASLGAGFGRGPHKTDHALVRQQGEEDGELAAANVAVALGL